MNTYTDDDLASMDLPALMRAKNAVIGHARSLEAEMADLLMREDRDSPGIIQRGKNLNAGIDKAMRESDRIGTYANELFNRADADVVCDGDTTAREPVSLSRGAVWGAEVDRRGPWADMRSRGTAMSERDLQGAALKAIELDPASDDDRKEAVTRMAERADGQTAAYIAAVSAPAYLRAFAKIYGDPELGIQRLEREEAEALAMVRAASVGTDSAGGYGTPLSIDPTMHLTDSAAPVNPFASVVNTVTIGTDKHRVINSTAATGSWDGEAAEVSDDMPTLSNTDITTHKLQVFVPASIEVTMDYPNFASEISTILVDQAAVREHAAIVSGTGSDQPYGLMTRLDGSASEVAPTTAEAFAEADVYKTAAAVPDRFWNTSTWAMHRGTSFDVRQFADGSTTGQHAMWAEFGAGTPATLLGRPVVLSQNLDNSNDIDAAATADNHVLIVGDFAAAYTWVRRIGFSIEVIPHLFGSNQRPTGQRAYYGYLRVGGDCTNVDALRVLNVATTA